MELLNEAAFASLRSIRGDTLEDRRSDRAHLFRLARIALVS